MWIDKQLKEIGLNGLDDPRNYISSKLEQKGQICYLQQRFFDICDTKDAKGLKINYFDFQKNTSIYDANGKERQFYRCRLEEPKGKQKYWQPFGSTNYIFNTPAVIDANNIQTLFVCEGEKKAFRLSLMGVNAVGIGGKDNFSEKNSKELLPQIQRIVTEKKVLNLVLLLDSDVFKLGENEDLFKRPSSFCNTVIRFNALCRPLNCNVYFAHVEESFLEQQITGIDDLINFYVNQNNDIAVNKILHELNLLAVGKQRDRNYIKCYNVSLMSEFNIKSLFHLESIYSFFEFYKLEYNTEYVLNKNTYKFYQDEKTGKLKHKMLSWGDANRYLKIGKDYKKIAYDQDSNLVFIDATKVSIKDDINTKSDAIFNHIRKVDGCTYAPDNTENYKDIIESYNLNGDVETKSLWFNKYQRLTYNYKDKEGSFENIDTMLKHLFSQKNILGDSLYEFALDYITLLFFYPTLRLPALCLVSNERATGKTTFLDFLKLLFKGNAVKADNTRFSEKWTSTYANNLVILVDETMQTEEQKQKKEMLKNLITSDTIWNEGKGVNAVTNRFFGKFIFASNDELNFMQIDNVENRFCVVKVQKLNNVDNIENFDILSKMGKELEVFLTFLYKRMQKNQELYKRPTYYEQRTRLYFDYKVYTTDALYKIQATSEDAYIRSIKEYLLDVVSNSNEMTVYFAPNDLRELFKIPLSNAKIADALRRLNFKQQKQMRYYTYLRNEIINHTGEAELRVVKIAKKGYPFKIDAVDLFDKEDFAEFCKELPQTDANIDNIITFNTKPLPF